MARASSASLISSVLLPCGNAATAQRRRRSLPVLSSPPERRKASRKQSRHRSAAQFPSPPAFAGPSRSGEAANGRSSWRFLSSSGAAYLYFPAIVVLAQEKNRERRFQLSTKQDKKTQTLSGRAGIQGVPALFLTKKRFRLSRIGNDLCDLCPEFTDHGFKGRQSGNQRSEPLPPSLRNVGQHALMEEVPRRSEGDVAHGALFP